VRRLAQFRKLRRIGQVGKMDRFAFFPDPTDETFVGIDQMRTEISLERQRCDGGLLQNAIGHIDKRRATLGKKSRHQFGAGAIDQVKRAAVGVENADATLDNQTVEIVRANDIVEGLAESVQEIEDEIFFDLNFFVRALEHPDAPALPLIGNEPAEKRGNKQPEEKKTHEAEAGLLLRRALVPEVLLEVFEDVLEAG
jgi:hypothetical protein